MTRNEMMNASVTFAKGFAAGALALLEGFGEVAVAYSNLTTDVKMLGIKNPNSLDMLYMEQYNNGEITSNALASKLYLNHHNEVSYLDISLRCSRLDVRRRSARY